MSHQNLVWGKTGIQLSTKHLFGYVSICKIKKKIIYYKKSNLSWNLKYINLHIFSPIYEGNLIKKITNSLILCTMKKFLYTRKL